MRPFPLLAWLVFNTLSSPFAYAVSPATLATAQAAAQQNHLRVTLLGDSIAEGANINPAKSWAAQWTADLQAKHPGTQVFNRSLGARSSTNFLKANFVGFDHEPVDLNRGYGPRNPSDQGRAWVKPKQSWHDAVEATHPNLLIIAMGMNEVWSGNTTTEVSQMWKKHLTMMLGDAAAWTPKPDIVLLTPTLASTKAPNKLPPVPRERLEAIAAVTRSVAAQHGLVVVDVQAAWRASRLTERQLLGTWPGTWNGIGGGGNGYNHPSQLATDEVIVPTMQAFTSKWLP